MGEGQVQGLIILVFILCDSVFRLFSLGRRPWFPSTEATVIPGNVLCRVVASWSKQGESKRSTDMEQAGMNDSDLTDRMAGTCELWWIELCQPLFLFICFII